MQEALPAMDKVLVPDWQQDTEFVMHAKWITW